MPTPQDQQLQAALEFVRLVAEDWFVQGEMYQQCFFCQELEPGEPGDKENYHKEDCPVLKAYKLLIELKQDA